MAPTEDPAPAVSVVVPTRNRADALRRCLEALAAQTAGSYEVIVVDDGSDDVTAAAIQDLAAAHAQLDLTILREARQIGANPARNRGIRAARAPVIAFTDDDCRPAPTWLERLLRAFDDETVAAATGRTENAPPRNLAELTWKGTQRVHARADGGATRLVGCNMAVRREHLLAHGLDEDRAHPDPDVRVSGRGDEEGLFLRLRAAGWAQRVVADAVVHHDHHHTVATLMRQGWRSGRAAARLVYKYRLPPRIDLVPLLLAWLTLPLGAVDRRLLLVPAAFAALQVAALAYNELARKGKTAGEMLLSFPLLLAYYHVRLAGYVVHALRLRLGAERLDRVAP